MKELTVVACQRIAKPAFIYSHHLPTAYQQPPEHFSSLPYQHSFRIGRFHGFIGEGLIAREFPERAGRDNNVYFWQ